MTELERFFAEHEVSVPPEGAALLQGSLAPDQMLHLLNCALAGQPWAIMTWLHNYSPGWRLPGPQIEVEFVKKSEEK